MFTEVISDKFKLNFTYISTLHIGVLNLFIGRERLQIPADIAGCAQEK